MPASCSSSKNTCASNIGEWPSGCSIRTLRSAGPGLSGISVENSVMLKGGEVCWKITTPPSARAIWTNRDRNIKTINRKDHLSPTIRRVVLLMIISEPVNALNASSVPVASTRVPALTLVPASSLVSVLSSLSASNASSCLASASAER